ncbi:Rap1a/Tai family immunity protein [Hyphomonas sp.]|uniref:Rap1a/Tai family immunity protein n=1 Tax=Hyphomonas sp. TaxID=87 RepID=UPI00342431C1
MKCLILIVSAFLALCSFSARATTGNELYYDCVSSNAYDQARCLSYISGVADGIGLSDHLGLCVPKGVTYGQLLDIVVGFLKGSPEGRHYAASFLIYTALFDAYGCQGEQ